jgi:hypothetical protein
MLGPTLQTPQLILRPPTIEDLDAVAGRVACEVRLSRVAPRR